MKRKRNEFDEREKKPNILGLQWSHKQYHNDILERKDCCYFCEKSNSLFTCNTCGIDYCDTCGSLIFYKDQIICVECKK